jgi:trans-2,3-dihydro-3-hydroxyanthranilate isomerase
MKTLPYTVYGAFTGVAFGGSPAACVLEAGELNDLQRHQIARELGIPATAFVENIDGYNIQLRFRSPTTEYPMCGHGTICLISHLIDKGLINPTNDNETEFEVTLKLPTTEARVEVNQQPNQKPEIWLDIKQAKIESCSVDNQHLQECLGLEADSFHPTLPIKRAVSDFRHIIVPLASLNAMQSIQADFSLMTQLSNQNNVDTIVVFCLETLDPLKNLHVRDFCPAVGSPESAATGTSNASLCSYLIEQGLFSIPDNQRLELLIEQGYEMGRPSLVQAKLTFQQNQLSRIQIGGVASRVFDGSISIP